MNNTNNIIEKYRGGRGGRVGRTGGFSYGGGRASSIGRSRSSGGDYRGSARVSSVGSYINYSNSASSTIEKYRGGRSGRSSGGGSGRGSSVGRSSSRGSRGSSRGSSRSSGRSSSRGSSIGRSSSRGSSIGRSSSKGTSYTPKISGGSFRPSFGVNSDNYYSGKNKPRKPHEKKVKPIESSYRQTSTSHTMGVHGGTQWFGWGPSVLYPIIDEPPEIIASMNDNNIEKKETMSISEYDEKIRKKYKQ